MQADWRILIEGRYYEMTGCTSCLVRRRARNILGGRGGEVVVERMIGGAYRPFMTFTVPEGGGRVRTTTTPGQPGQVRRVPQGVRAPGQRPQHRSQFLGRPRRPGVPNMFWQPSQP